jgi:hypothetical protein
MAPFGSEAKESTAPCLVGVKGQAPHTSLEVFLGICSFSCCGCEARVTGKILLEGLKVALDRCASSRFRVVVAVRLRGG